MGVEHVRALKIGPCGKAWVPVGGAQKVEPDEGDWCEPAPQVLWALRREEGRTGEEVSFEDVNAVLGRVGAVIVGRHELESDDGVHEEILDGLWTLIVAPNVGWMDTTFGEIGDNATVGGE